MQIHLLFTNLDILLSGTRRNLFLIANAILEKILKDEKLLLKKIIQGNNPSLMEIFKCNEPFLQYLKGKKHHRYRRSKDDLQTE